ncbi:MAG: hypothetical protein L0Z73_06040 [Gammaproteobacteria bacterium]|nr:hypothetical protein [Gammaproteobacteria bacterium]
MKHNYVQALFTRVLNLLLVSFIATGLYACASSSESGESSASTTGTAAGSESANNAAPASTDATATGSSSNAVNTEAAAPAVEPQAAVPPRIVESCKDEPFSKYEQQARESLAKGLNATKAGKFGVGFRDVNEHNAWSNVHNELFRRINEACGVLSECARTHKKDKDTECVAQAKSFDEWQKLAKDFADKAKTAETTQPPKICALTPNLDEPARCFHGLADNIDKACDNETCKETSNCWRSVGFLDAAIIQAEQACGFVHQKLSECRGYTEVTGRRKNKFAQCEELHGRLGLTIFPVL